MRIRPHTADSRLAWWLPWCAVLALVALLGAQERWAPLPASRTTPLWVSVAIALVATLALRSEWGDESLSAAAQQSLGTTSNSFYGPRRRWLSEGGTIIGGMAGGIWWGASSWIVLGNAIWRGAATAGLIALELAVLAGVITGALVGALAGRLVGHGWERWHRARRLRRQLRVVRGGRPGGGSQRRAS